MYHPIPNTRMAAQLRASEEDASSLFISADADIPLDPFSATSAVLDPERTTATLGYTWLTHWQLIEEDRQFRQLVFESTRGRQMQRHQQLMEMLGGSVSIDNKEEEEDSIGFRIVHGRLSVVGAEAEQEQVSSSIFSSKENTSAQEVDLHQGDRMDDLAWLASHPEVVAPRPDLTQSETEENFSSSSSSTSTTMNNSQTSTSSTTTTAATTTPTSILPGIVQLQLGSEIATVRPLWISIYIEESTGIAKLFESVVPLESGIVHHMKTDLTPFCSISGQNFGDLADLRDGPWLNYFVGLVGGVAVEAEDILWPNQILHKDRVLYNVRDASDVARFLADPRKEDVIEHAANLKRLAEERGYRKGWCWYMLRSRWGLSVLKKMGIDAN